MSKEEIEMSEKVRGKGTSFTRIRRITGYLVGGLDRFNSGKKAEEHDRVKHGMNFNVNCGCSEDTMAEQISA